MGSSRNKVERLRQCGWQGWACKQRCDKMFVAVVSGNEETQRAREGGATEPVAGAQCLARPLRRMPLREINGPLKAARVSMAAFLSSSAARNACRRCIRGW